jgi:HupE / UreJ protein
VIALTVCYKAFDNLDGFKKYLGIASPNILLAVFIFGLIHGLGLATRLQELPLGRDGLMVLRILTFNIGVELGQITALVVMLLVLSQLRGSAYFQRFSKVANAGLMAAGVLLLLMQLHGYQHTRFADDFPLNRDEHYHMHEQMDTNRDIEATAPVR